MKFLLLFSFIILTSDGGEISNLKSYPIPKQEDVKNFKDWSAYVVSIKDGKACYDFSGEKWNKRAKLNFEIDRAKEKEAYFTHPTNAIKVNDGWLVGFDRGEWSGALYWYSDDGKKKYLVADTNVHNIIELNNRIYITQGLAHLASDYGTISEIKFLDNKWSVFKTKNLKGCPYQSTIFKDKLLIMSTEDIVLFNLDLTIIEKFENGFFSDLYPNSVIIDNEIAYFGMRGGILKLTVEKGTADWLTE